MVLKLNFKGLWRMKIHEFVWFDLQCIEKSMFCMQKKNCKKCGNFTKANFSFISFLFSWVAIIEPLMFYNLKKSSWNLSWQFQQNANFLHDVVQLTSQWLQKHFLHPPFSASTFLCSLVFTSTIFMMFMHSSHSCWR